MKKVKKGWLISQNPLAKITNFTSEAANFTDIPTSFTISLLLIAISIDIYPSTTKSTIE
ncbi:hypothetical protein [Algoriphagus resistens]|uniref:hypothetical protein n=1 Tax=Algoriphagus resistens TaxID=1750590 RepID=UPI000AFACF3D|nr:hypothetical protein [Algoriphagus resistens]